MQVQRLVSKVSTFMAGVGVQLLTPVAMLFAISAIVCIRGGPNAELFVPISMPKTIYGAQCLLSIEHESLSAEKMRK